jgi:hypothetical protein
MLTLLNVKHSQLLDQLTSLKHNGLGFWNVNVFNHEKIRTSGKSMIGRQCHVMLGFPVNARCSCSCLLSVSMSVSSPRLCQGPCPVFLSKPGLHVCTCTVRVHVSVFVLFCLLINVRTVWSKGIQRYILTLNQEVNNVWC